MFTLVLMYTLVITPGVSYSQSNITQFFQSEKNCTTFAKIQMDRLKKEPFVDLKTARFTCVKDEK